MLHPVGALQVSQRAVPLALELDKFGNQQPADVEPVRRSRPRERRHRSRVADVRRAVRAGAVPGAERRREALAPAFSSCKAASSSARRRAVAVERRSRGARSATRLTIIDKEPAAAGALHVGAGPALFDHVPRAARAVARSPLSLHAKSQLAARSPTGSRSAAEGYTVASTADNTASAADATFSSEAMARDDLRRRLAAEPGARAARCT